MGQYFGKETIKKLAKLSNTSVSLPAGANLRIGGQAYSNASNVVCNTGVLGAGGLDVGTIQASTMYYVYAVVSSGIMALVASQSASSPSGFNAYRKIGAFYTDGSSNVFRSFYFEEINLVSFSAAIDGSVSPATVSEENVDWISGDLSRDATGEYTGIFTANMFSVAPHMWGSVDTTSTIAQTANVYNVTNTQFQVVRAGSAKANATFRIFALRRGIDAVQPDWSL